VANPVPDQSSPDSDSDYFSGLERELAAALRELEEYQRLIDELPQIYEDKFGAQVLALAQEIALLTDERHRLQLLIQDCIQDDAVLPPARSSTGDSLPLGWHGPQRWLGRLAPRSLTLLAAGSLSVILAVGLAWHANKRRPMPGSPTVSREDVPARPQAPLVVPRPAAPMLRLRSRDEVWLELRSAENQLVFVGTLNRGQTLTFPYSDGMRIRSGRPHQLDLSLDEKPYTPLGVYNDYAWQAIVVPLNDHSKGKAEHGDQAS
jgi:hypothetical protein